MNLISIIFLIIVLAIYTCLNYYIGIKLFKAFTFWFSINTYVYWACIVVMSISFFLGRFSSGHFPVTVTEITALIGDYWLFFFYYALILFFIQDLVLLIFRFTSYDTYTNWTSGGAYSARILISALLIVIFAVYGAINASTPQITTYNVHIDKNAGSIKNLKAVAVSDIHTGDVLGRKEIQKLSQIVQKLNPDILLIGGDIIDQDLNRFKKDNVSEIYRSIKPKYGIYGIMGNHDYFSGRTEEVEKAFDDAGIKILRDKCVLVDNSFYVAGREDISVKREKGTGRIPLKDVFSLTDKSRPLILMDHAPVNLEESEGNGVDLEFSGHTHGGQFFPNTLITNRMYEVAWGLLKKGNFTEIVSCGYGTWGPPIRIGTKSEVVVINITFK